MPLSWQHQTKTVVALCSFHPQPRTPRYQDQIWRGSSASKQGTRCLCFSRKGSPYSGLAVVEAHGQSPLPHFSPSFLSPRFQLRVSSAKKLTLAVGHSFRRPENGWQGTDKMPPGDAAQPETWPMPPRAGTSQYGVDTRAA